MTDTASPWQEAIRRIKFVPSCQPEGEDAMAVQAKLDQVNFVVGDMGAMAAFYRHLGVSVDAGAPEWTLHHRSTEVDGVTFDLDSPQFAGVWNTGWPGGPGLVLGFRVSSREDVDRAYAELIDAGYEGQQPPYDAFWGARYAVVADPDGNSVGLMSPIDPARRSPPPTPPP